MNFANPAPLQIIRKALFLFEKSNHTETDIAITCSGFALNEEEVATRHWEADTFSLYGALIAVTGSAPSSRSPKLFDDLDRVYELLYLSLPLPSGAVRPVRENKGNGDSFFDVSAFVEHVDKATVVTLLRSAYALGSLTRYQTLKHARNA